MLLDVPAAFRTSLLAASLILPASALAETVTVPFTASGGANTSSAFGGVTAFHVTGTGYSVGTCNNDAFYVYSCGTPYYNASYYHLRINGGHPAPPPYTTSHEYWFLHNVGGSGTVNLKVSDGNYTDNGGSYVVDVNVYTPAVADGGGPYTTTEGTALSLSGGGSVGTGGILDYSWDCETDGTIDSSGTSNSVSCTYPDDGSFTATLVVTDQYGGTGTGTATVAVSNVAPTITTAAPTTGVEGTLYSYSPAATDPAGAADPLVWSLPVAPAGASLGLTTELTWTPTLVDALASPHSFELLVDDGDGGQTTEAWSVTVTFIDDDVDGMADAWETANGLDPTTSDDATEDPDADGLSNLEEFLGGTDPNTYDGPGGVTLISPIGGAEVASATPEYVVDGATDPSGDVMTLDIEVYADAALTVLVDSVAALAEDPSGTTTWTGATLAENALHHWRARASDPYVAGAWTAAESFFVNAIEEAPSAPVPWSPLDGDVVGSVSPALQFGIASDPDGDVLTYAFELDLDGGGAVDDAADLGDDGTVTTWTPATVLSEDTVYVVRAQATDDTGLTGPWSDDVTFVISTTDGAPSTPTIERPEDGSEIDVLSPDVLASGAVDPEGQPLTYEFELSLDPAFATTVASGDVPETDGAALWDLDSAVLEDHIDHHVRVRAFDGTLASDWAVGTFFTNTANEAPSVPVLVGPLDGALLGDDVRAAWANDLDRDVLLYDVVIATDAELLDAVDEAIGLAGGNALLDGAGEVTHTPDLDPGTWYWSARAVDEHGLASEWAPTESFVIAEPDLGDDDDDDGDNTQDPACGCGSSMASGPAAGWSLAFLVLFVGVHRRRGPRRSSMEE